MMNCQHRNSTSRKLLAAKITIAFSILALVFCKDDFAVESDYVGNKVCFTSNDNNNNNNNYQDDINNTSLKEKCCSAFLSEGKHKLDATVESDSLINCMDRISIVPSVHSKTGSSESTFLASLVPRYYLHTYDDVENKKHNLDSTAIPASNHLESNNEPKMYSPFHFYPQLNTGVDEGMDQMYRIYHHSFLSTHGGMHRAFVNEIAISLDADEGYAKRQPEGIYLEDIHIDGTLFFIFPILEGYFIDLDDPFQEDLDQPCRMRLLQLMQHQGERSCQMEIITTPKDLVIDIEQPSFASKQHVIAFRIDVHASLIDIPTDEINIIDSTKSLLEITFVPMIHIRYQSSIVGESHRESSFVPIPVSNIFLHTSNMITTFTYSNGDRDTEYSNLHIAHQLQELQQTKNIIVEVASGLDSHHNVVMVFTILACMVGTIQMIRDFSKIGRWY